MRKSVCRRCGKLIPFGESCPCRHKSYDKTVRHKRDARLTAFYHSAEWQTMQQYIIVKYNGIDLYAYYVKHELIPATTVHHIKPLREKWELRLAESNLIPLSARSHGEIEALYKTDKRHSTQALLCAVLDEWNNTYGET